MLSKESKMSKGKGNSNKGEKPAGPIHCSFVECKKDSKKFGFCKEHFELYMAGIIRGDGTKPTDYEKKLQQHLKSKKKVA